MSQKDLEKISGILQPNISRIERGNTDITVSMLCKLARALKLPPGDLLNDQVFMNNDRPSSLTRDDLETIAVAVWQKPSKLDSRRRRIAEAFRLVMPEFYLKRIPKHQVHMAWLDLKTLLSQQEIRNLKTRVEKARQRFHATGNH